MLSWICVDPGAYLAEFSYNHHVGSILLTPLSIDSTPTHYTSGADPKWLGSAVNMREKVSCHEANVAESRHFGRSAES